MWFEIREVDNGWVVKGNTKWYGDFEFFRPTLPEAMRRISEMKKITKRRTL